MQTKYKVQKYTFTYFPVTEADLVMVVIARDVCLLSETERVNFVWEKIASQMLILNLLLSSWP